MPSFKIVAEGVVLALGFIAIPASMAAVFDGIGDTVGVVQQTSVQRGIDAHTERLSAVYTEDVLIRNRSEYVYQIGLIEDGIVLIVSVLAMLFAFKPWRTSPPRQQPVRRKTRSRRR